jgi:hypothetical protein
MTRYLVRAREWRQGWELHVDGVGVTQVDAQIEVIVEPVSV